MRSMCFDKTSHNKKSKKKLKGPLINRTKFYSLHDSNRVQIEFYDFWSTPIVHISNSILIISETLPRIPLRLI